MKLFAISILAFLGLLGVVSGLDPSNKVAESSVTGECRDGDTQCEVLPLILLGRHAIKRCNDHKWYTREVCNPEDVCNPKPYPHCAGVVAIKARGEDNDEDSLDAEQIHKAEMPCSKCKTFRDQCYKTCCRGKSCGTLPPCHNYCINKMKKHLVEDGKHGRYRGTCQDYCPQLCE